MKRTLLLVVGLSLLLLGGSFVLSRAGTVYAATESGSVGIEGTISSPPPTTPATISIPRSGQSFTTLPITVSGLCTGDLLIKLFKNNVFAGSAQCKNGSFSIVTDLFNGQNDLVARVYDSLDQAGPDSNVVSVTFSDPRQGAGSRVSLTSNFAKRGANPGQLLTWPITISGGTGPYALSIDWGDSKAPDLKSQAFPGNLSIEHTYDNAGVYNIVIKATDANGTVAFLQLVGVANGPLGQTEATNADNGDSSAVVPPPQILWQPAVIMIPFIISTFWLGKRYQIHDIKKRIERGERPF